MPGPAWRRTTEAMEAGHCVPWAGDASAMTRRRAPQRRSAQPGLWLALLLAALLAAVALGRSRVAPPRVRPTPALATPAAEVPAGDAAGLTAAGSRSLLLHGGRRAPGAGRAP